MRRFHCFRFSGVGRSGQSLMEVLVAVAVGVVMLLGALTAIAPIVKISSQVARSQVAGAAAKDLADTVRVWAESDWHGLYGLVKTSANPYFLIAGSSSVTVVSGTEYVPADEVTAGLIGAWRFDEGAGTTVLDYAGNATPGTWYGSGPNHWGAGEVGPFAGRFNGTDDMVALSSSTANVLKQPLGSLTVSAWVYPTATANQASGYGIISNEKNSSGWGMYLKGGYLLAAAHLSGTSVSQQFADASVPLNAWSNIAFTYDGSQVVAYLNGGQLGNAVPASGVVDVSQNGSMCTVIGVDPKGGSLPCTGGLPRPFFPGFMDDLRVYNRALVPSEVAKIYQGGVSTRYFYVDNVSRDASGFITLSAGTNDPSTQKVTVGYSWPGASTSRSFTEYLTRFRAAAAVQSDWTGGGGQATSVKSFGSFFTSSTNIDYTSSTGSLIIRGY